MKSRQIFTFGLTKAGRSLVGMRFGGNLRGNTENTNESAEDHNFRVPRQVNFCVHCTLCSNKILVTGFSLRKIEGENKRDLERLIEKAHSLGQTVASFKARLRTSVKHSKESFESI